MNLHFNDFSKRSLCILFENACAFLNPSKEYMKYISHSSHRCWGTNKTKWSSVDKNHLYYIGIITCFTNFEYKWEKWEDSECAEVMDLFLALVMSSFPEEKLWPGAY